MIKWIFDEFNDGFREFVSMIPFTLGWISPVAVVLLGLYLAHRFQ